MTEQQSLIRTSKEGPPESEHVTECIEKIEAEVSTGMLTLCTKAAHVEWAARIYNWACICSKRGSATGHPDPDRLTGSQHASLVSAAKQWSTFRDTLVQYMFLLDVDLGVTEIRHFSVHAYGFVVIGHLVTQDLPEWLG